MLQAISHWSMGRRVPRVPGSSAGSRSGAGGTPCTRGAARPPLDLIKELVNDPARSHGEWVRRTVDN
jgi:hypothetical protein